MKNYLSLIKFSHTIFALPFALVGYFLGVIHTNAFDGKILLLVLLCMIFARSAAMAFNRYIDRDIDKANARTASREIPAGVVSSQNALVFVLINSILLIVTTYFINPICFYLSPIALLITLGYSYTKRFTSLCHFVLGLGLALAPVGAYLAVTASFHIVPILYGMVVLFWVAGFDIIYALQDTDFDKEQELYSVPTRFGKKSALGISKFLHLGVASILLLTSYLVFTELNGMDYIHWIGTFAFLVLLAYQHSLVSPNDLSKVNLAFFTTNGVASVIFGSFFILDYFL